MNILLYSPDVIGHPRVYCRVIADALAGEDCSIVLAMGFGEQAELAECHDLLPLCTRKSLKIVDTRHHSATAIGNLTTEELVNLQAKFAIQTTLFIEADKSNSEFARIAARLAPRLRGRNIGIFANTAEWYPGEDSFTGERRGLLAPTLRTTLGNIKRAIFNRHQRLSYFYEKTILGAKVLDEIVVKDERLADWYGEPIYWMPEISRPIAEQETESDATSYRQREKELSTFLQSNSGKEPVLYFGDAAFYKGYDLFLEFVSKNPSVCAIHAGRCWDGQQSPKFTCDVSSLGAQLRSEGRLYETNEYVHSQRLKELYFGAVRVYITTHRLTLSSSTMIQALEMGKPVLVPDRGLIGYRVSTNCLGDVYTYGDMADLSIKAQALWESDLSRFSASVSQFWASFSDQSVRAFFVRRLLDKKRNE